MNFNNAIFNKEWEKSAFEEPVEYPQMKDVMLKVSQIEEKYSEQNFNRNIR